MVLAAAGADVDPVDMAHVCERPKRFLLIERNVEGYEPSHRFTTFDTLDLAGDYAMTREYAEDWRVLCAVDLDSGAGYTAEPYYSVAWTAYAAWQEHVAD